MSVIGNKAILAKNLNKYIALSGKDRRELAEIWGFPYSTVSEWVNGRKYPRIDRIEIMADYFGILKSDLIEEKTSEDSEKKNDILSDIIVRMRTDDEFMLLVEAIHTDDQFMSLVEVMYNLDTEKLDGVKQFLKAFTK